LIGEWRCSSGSVMIRAMLVVYDVVYWGSQRNWEV
jgi:hypothetical protein